jgi:hypothetical protein
MKLQVNRTQSPAGVFLCLLSNWEGRLLLHEEMEYVALRNYPVYIIGEGRETELEKGERQKRFLFNYALKC